MCRKKYYCYDCDELVHVRDMMYEGATYCRQCDAYDVEYVSWINKRKHFTKDGKRKEDA